MRISGLQKLTLQDYPDKLACIIFTQGCNFRCPFCQNSTLLDNTEGIISESEIFDYLDKRKNILDGVVITGGEPTIQPDLKNFIIKVRSYGLSVKLDTNGFKPDILEDLINNNLLDYVAMDVKNSLVKYSLSTGVNIKLDNILRSIEILKNSNIDYEFRTTIMKEHHTVEDIKSIIEMIGNSKYFLQNFKDSENVLNKDLHSFSDSELELIANEIKDNGKVRGL